MTWDMSLTGRYEVVKSLGILSTLRSSLFSTIRRLSSKTNSFARLLAKQKNVVRASTIHPSQIRHLFKREWDSIFGFKGE
jgi:hypothetical protein